MNFTLLACLFFAAVALANYAVFRSVLYPPFIFCAMWCLALGLYTAGWIEVDPVHPRALLIIGSGGAAFSLGGLASVLVPAELLQVRWVMARSSFRSEGFRTAVVTVLACALPMLVLQVFRLSQQGQGTGILMRARDAMVTATVNGQEIHSFVMDYFLTFAIPVALLMATGKKDWLFWTMTLITFAGCVLSTARTNTLQLLGGLTAIQMLMTRRDRFLSAASFLKWPVLLFVVLYSVLIFVDKDTSGYAGGVTGVILYFVVSYIVGPTAAFDQVVRRPQDFTVIHGHTFEFFLKLAAVLHLRAYDPPPKLDTFVMVPFPTNVFTVFKFYYLELGWVGTCLVMLLIGFLHSLLFRKARTGSLLSIALFGFSIFPVLMVIFDDLYFTIGAFVRTFAVLAVYTLLSATSFHFWPARQAGLEASTRRTA